MCVSDCLQVSGESPPEGLGRLADVLSTASFALDEVDHSRCVAVGRAVCEESSSGDSASHGS